MEKIRFMVVGFLALVLTSTFVFGYSGGIGTEADPYLIANKADLLQLGSTTVDYDKHFKMTSDIDLSGTNFTSAIIGEPYNPFAGTFDGDNHKIINLIVETPYYNHTIGLFGYNEGIIRNLLVENCKISGGKNVGGLTGYNGGIVENIAVAGQVSGSDSVGMLTGCNEGNISECSVDGLISDTYDDINVYASGLSSGVGGLVGLDSGNISNSYSTVNVYGRAQVGGLVGNKRWGNIISSYASGKVVGNENVGGLVGIGVESAAVTASFWDTETSGQSASAGGTGKTTAEMQTQSIFTINGWNFTDVWTMSDSPKLQAQNHVPEYYILSVVDGNGDGVYSSGQDIIVESIHPDLFDFIGWTVEPVEYTNNFSDISSFSTTFIMPYTNVFITAVLECYSGGTGTESDPYQIGSKDDLLTLGNCPQHYDKHFKMISDIDLAGTNFTRTVIASNTSLLDGGFHGTAFTGVFEGNGKKILNLSIASGSDAYYVGLFGYIGSGGEIKNLGIVDCDVNGDGYVGGLCGYNYNGTISSCSSTGSVSGGDYVGGLCGYNYNGTISFCYSTGTVSGNYEVGGLCGYNYNGTISSCYSIGRVVGNYYVGGLCGANTYGDISYCFWDTETSSLLTSDGCVGKTTSQMQTQSTFTDAGWDFVDTWKMYGYPVLQLFYTASNTYPDWLSASSIPANEQGYTNAPAGDGIQNLLKYAIGLNPMDSCSAADVMDPSSDDTNGVSIIYNKAKGSEGVELFPMWSDCLLPSNWNPNGFEFSIISQTASNSTWKATHSVTGECGYIRLKAQEN